MDRSPRNSVSPSSATVTPRRPAVRCSRARRPGADRGTDHARAARPGPPARASRPAGDDGRGRTVARRAVAVRGGQHRGARRGARRGSGSAAPRRRAWSGRRVEAIIDIGFDADSPGFQCEALVRDANGRPVQGIHPRRQAVPVDAVERLRRADRRGGVEPDVPAVPAVAARLAGHRRRQGSCTGSTAPTSWSSTPRPRRCCTT